MAVAPQLALPHVIANGDDFDATPVEENFIALRDEVNTHAHTEYAVKGLITVGDLAFDIGTQAELDTETSARIAADALLVPKDGSYATVGTAVLQARVTGDASSRFQLGTDGKHSWGPGTGATDIDLSRPTVGMLKATGVIAGTSFQASTSNAVIAGSGQFTTVTGAGVRAFRTLLSASDTFEAFSIAGDGTHKWGIGGASATDANLYRSGVGILKTDTAFTVGGNLTVLASAFLSGAGSRFDATAQTAGTAIFVTRQTGEANNRLTIDNTGKHNWGDGTLATDTNLYRRNAGELAHDGLFAVIGAAAGSVGLSAHVTGDAARRFTVQYNGAIGWGDGVSSPDVSLSRTGGGQLAMVAGLFQNTGEIRALTATTAFGAIQAGDTRERFSISGSGSMGWGDGTAVQDTSLSRIASGNLQLSNRLSITNASNATALSTIISADTNSRFAINHDGTHTWGPGNAGQDTTFARNSAGILQIGAPAQAGRLIVFAGSAGGIAHSVRITTDTNDRFQISGDGKLGWGPGNAVSDITLTRNASGQLAVGGEMKSLPSTATSPAFSAAIGADVTPRFLIDASGKMTWGDGTLARDVNLYRSAAGIIQTDQIFKAVGGFSAPGMAAATTQAFGSNVVGDTAARFSLSADGKMVWSSGAGSSDIDLFRFGANRLGTTGNIRSTRTLASSTAFESAVTGDAVLRWSVGADGKFQWGDGTNAQDTNLSRSAVGTLHSDGALDLGLAADTAARLIVHGGAGGNAMIQLVRTSGASITYSWALTGGGLSFSDDTNGFVVGNFFGDISTNQLFVGQRGKTLLDTRETLISATSFSAAAGNDVAAQNLNLQGGLGTGAGTPGAVVIKTGNTTTSGSQQSSVTRVTVAALTGRVTLTATGKAALSISDTTTTTGITIGGDTTLYRNASNVLKTDGAFIAAGTITGSANFSVTNGSGNGFFSIGGTLTDTAVGAVAGINAQVFANPAAVSAAEFRSLTMSALVPSTNAQDFSSIVKGAHLEARWNGSGNVTGTGGLVGAAVSTVIPAAGISFGTIASATGLMATGMTEFATAAITGTVTNVFGIGVISAGRTNITIVNNIGIDVAAQAAGTTLNVGVRIAKSTTAALQLSGTDGTAPSGILFGSDTNLYRTAAARLRTDHFFQATALGIATKQKAGTPTDADWALAPPDGTVVVDSTGSKIWARVNGVWKSAALV